MNKILAVLVATVALGASAADSYLYWMVSAPISWTGETPTTDIKYARVGVMDNTTGKNAGYLNIFSQVGEGTGSKLASDFLGNSLYANLERG